SISFPLLGKVDVAGYTPQEAENRIAELLAEQYMHDPHVIVSVKEYRSQRVAVIGSVKNPGTYELLGKGTLLDALALAGGLGEKASDTVYVTRKTGDGGEQSVQVDLDELLDKGDASLNVTINMGDVVYVPEAGVVYVDGAVVKPGTYPITDDMTVSQAVTAAGGMDKTAKASDVRLLRNRDGQVEVLPINLESIKDGEMPDMILEDQDVVVVGKSAFKSFFDAIKLGLFFPPFSMGVQ
ncbi:MAG: SLBB domain-containing protein, partial [Candidatus Dadabacteria bacterium]|nr:SLBB domain-containing protein [Candidatus Dadabacteria bacterium]